MKRHNEPKRIIYYRDAFTEDYAGTNIQTQTVHADFPFLPEGLLFRIFGWIVYYLIAIPLVHIYCYVICGYHLKNKKAVRALKESGFFLYANHTHFTDAFLAPIVAFPKRAFVLVSPDTVSIKGIRTLVQILGAIPIPQDRKAFPLFCSAVETRAVEGRCISIFPEAHMWNYCTFVRPFHAGSFRYPISYDKPSVAVAVTYQQRKCPLFRRPKRTVFVSDPIYPDQSLSAKAAQRKLAEEVERFIREKTEQYSDYKYFDYRQQQAE